MVTIQNIGQGNSDSSMTEVEFWTNKCTETNPCLFSLAEISIPTPGLKPEESIELVFKIPDDCFDPVCNFNITVDKQEDVVETEEGETNNIIEEAC